MTAEAPFSCRPDKYLTQSHLQELFNDFNTSLETSRPAAFVFASLVNSVRIAYKDPLLEAREELLHKSEDYARQLAELKLERRGKSGPLVGERLQGAPASTDGDETDGDETDSGDEAAELKPPHSSIKIQHEKIVNTFPLYIFSTQNHHRCDYAQWSTDPLDESDWGLRMDFRVFKFQEPGLIKIFVMGKNSPRRMLAVRSQHGLDRWWEVYFHFWAYGEPRPGTQRIWVGCQDGPERGIFVKGNNRDGMEEWKERCEFWVPI